MPEDDARVEILAVYTGLADQAIAEQERESGIRAAQVATKVKGGALDDDLLPRNMWPPDMEEWAARA
jgi:hypothetical protein